MPPGSEGPLSVQYKISKVNGLSRMSTKNRAEDQQLFIESVFDIYIFKKRMGDYN